MNMKLIETLLVALLPLFAATSAAYADVTPPEHEVEGKIRGSDSKGAEDFLTDPLEKDKPNLLKGAEGALAANHAHGGRMLGKEQDDAGLFSIGAGGMAGEMVDYILEKAGVSIDTCGDTPLTDADTQKIKCLIGTAGYAALTVLCNQDQGVTRLCMLDSVVAGMNPLTEGQQNELLQVAKDLILSPPAPPAESGNLFTASSATTTSMQCIIDQLKFMSCLNAMLPNTLVVIIDVCAGFVPSDC